MPANWWVFYVPGDADYWQDLEYVAGVAETEDSSEDGGWWTCNEETVEGDRALLYAKAPISAIVGILEATSPAREHHHEFSVHPWICDFGCITVFEQPIPFRAMRADQQLRNHWGLIRGNFQPPGGKPPRVSGSTLRLLADRFPQLKPYVR